MNPLSIRQVPTYIQKEIDLISKRVKPLVKKSSTYAFVSIPLILFSLTNLIILFFNNGFNREMWITILIFAAFAAIGMALSKESKTLQKEILKKTNDYIIERIKKSSIVPDFKKKEFMNLIKAQPVLGFNTFINFLEEEKRLSNLERYV
ncbi:DUF5392 family protein [Niallia sp. Krafla_26]|uniref:DUF5392 family protein n=1 Tax=Niallia sp. Krafla_26 TaxID=3064703 RepID=UPI003D16D81F